MVCWDLRREKGCLSVSRGRYIPIWTLLAISCLTPTNSEAGCLIRKRVMVSTFNATRAQCGALYNINSDGSIPVPGDAGIAPTLRSALKLKWGDTVHVPGCGTFNIATHTNSRFKRTVDLHIRKGEEHWRGERVVTFIRRGCVLKNKHSAKKPIDKAHLP